MVEPITTIADCSDRWLSEVLGQQVGIEGIEPVAAGVGLLGEVHRVRLRGADVDSVIVKLAAPDNVAIARQFRYYEREAGAYRDLLPLDGLATPHCHLNGLRDGLPCLVLEDLADHRPGNQLTGLDRADAEAAVDAAAALHAACWDDPSLHDLAWMPGPADPVINGYGVLFDLTWKPFLSGPGAETPADLRAAALRARPLFDEVCAHFDNPPVTAVHGDFRLDNLLFGPDGAVVTVDWQLTARGRGPYDLAFLLAGSAEPAFRAAHERSLVERYHRGLIERGVADYPIEQCWDDYRRGHVMNLPNPITAAVAVDPGNERGRQLLVANAARALAAVADLW